MAPTPKPPGQRRRRNANQTTWRQLPAAGSKRKAPPLPSKRKPTWLKATRDWWKRAWASPMATIWLDSDVDSMYRLAYLRESAFRNPENASLHTQITAIEDRLGLSPAARRRLQWEVSQAANAAAEQADAAAAAPAGRKGRHLRAVQTDAA